MTKIWHLGSGGLGSYRRFKVWFFWKMMNDSFLLGETAVWIEFFEKIFFQNVLHKIAHRMIVTEFSIWTWVLRRLSPNWAYFIEIRRNQIYQTCTSNESWQRREFKYQWKTTRNRSKMVQNGPKWPIKVKIKYYKSHIKLPIKLIGMKRRIWIC